MKYIKLGDLEVTRIGLSAMSMSHAYTGASTDDAESIRTIHRALDLGVTFIDTAEVYGPFTKEELVGRALKGRRDGVGVVLAHRQGAARPRREAGRLRARKLGSCRGRRPGHRWPLENAEPGR